MKQHMGNNTQTNTHTHTHTHTHLDGTQARPRTLCPPDPKQGHTATAVPLSTRCRETLPSLIPHRNACVCRIFGQEGRAIKSYGMRACRCVYLCVCVFVCVCVCVYVCACVCACGGVGGIEE